MVVASNVAYVASDMGLEMIDVSNPFIPTDGGIYTKTYPSDMVISGTVAYLAAQGDGLQILDISKPFTPTALSAYAVSSEHIDDVAAVVGNYAYLIEEYGNLRVMDISNPAYPVEVGSYTERDVLDAAIAGNYAYLIADGDLAVLDISNPFKPSEVGFYATPGSARDVAVAGNHAYVADNDEGLQIINVSSPNNPTLAGSYDLPDGAQANSVAITADQAYAYVAQSYRLYVIDISNPSNPAEMSYSSLSSYEDMVVAGNYLYVARGSEGLRVLDISYPPVPIEVDTMYGWFGDLAIAGDYLYATRGDDLEIIDISDPSNLVSLASYETTNPRGVAAAGNYAYIANYEGGLLILNVAHPSEPYKSGVYAPPGRAVGVAIAGHYAYLVDDDGNLRMIDVSNLVAPLEVGYYRLPAGAFGVAAANNYIYAAGGDGGLFILRSAANPPPVVYSEWIYLPLVLR